MNRSGYRRSVVIFSYLGALSATSRYTSLIKQKTPPVRALKIVLRSCLSDHSYHSLFFCVRVRIISLRVKFNTKGYIAAYFKMNDMKAMPLQQYAEEWSKSSDDHSNANDYAWISSHLSQSSSALDNRLWQWE